MSEEAPILDEDNWFIGEDKILKFIIRTGKKIIVTAAANIGATSISVQRLNEAIANGAKVYFPDNETTVTLSGAAAIGATSIAVTATDGDVDAGEIGKKIQDITGYALQYILRRRADDPAEEIAKTTSSGIAITDGTGGACEVTINDTDTDALAAVQYFQTIRRTDEGSETVLAFGSVVLKKAAAP